MHITRCERHVDGHRCEALAVIYAAGQWVCAIHTPRAAERDPEPSP